MFLFKLKLDWVLCIVTDTERGLTGPTFMTTTSLCFMYWILN